jgi:chromate transporter
VTAGATAAASAGASASRAASSAWEVLRIFLRLGCVALGGPTAHIALMHREFVVKRGWLDDVRFLELLTASYLVPGPNSTMMSMNIGYVRRRDAGVWLAGLGFILPGVLLALGLAWWYARFSDVAEVRAAFWGLQAVVLALIVHALAQLAPRAVTGRAPVLLFAVGLVAAALGMNAVLLVALAGVFGLARVYWRSIRPATLSLSLALPLLGLPLYLRALAEQSAGDGGRVLQLGWVFLKVALILFDGTLFVGYVKSDVVDGYGWLTSQQLLDAIALGQATPGPVTKSSTIIGYLTAGMPGALVATLAMFVPSFLFAMLLGRSMRFRERSAAFGTVLQHMLPAVVALMVVVSAALARDSLTHPLQAALALGSLVILQRRATDGAVLLVAGALVGVGWHGVGW